MIALPDTLRDLLRHHPAWYALLAALGLTTIGLLALETASHASMEAQLRWLLIAVLAGTLCLFPHPRTIGLASYGLLALMLILLALLIMPGMPDSLVPLRNGARSWFNLGFMSFQPSEIAKIAFVLALARYLRFRENYRTLPGLLLPFCIAFIPVLLILKEPDLGTALLFGPALFAVLLAAGARMRHMLWLLGLAAVGVVLILASVLYAPPRLQILKPHQAVRVRSLIAQVQGDTRYDNTTAYQQVRGIYLVGAGGLTGYGADRARTILNMNDLPFPQNDMIFAVVVLRWGLAGGAAVLALFGALYIALLAAAARCKDPFARLAIIGFAGILFVQTTINIGMTLGLLPIIGINLPFVSYGGSSLLASYIMIGLTMNFTSRPAARLTRPSFEFDNADAIFQ